MASQALGPFIEHIRRLVGVSAPCQTSDLQLLRQFADDQDEAAFAELMRRHGPLVLSVCRRILRHEQDAEDAFQAAFLVLARKAGTIRKGESIGSFLYGVAYRIALKERGRLAQRHRREQQGERSMPAKPDYEAAFRELQLLLDEGLNRLAEKYRTPFVLCCLEGKSKSEAASELGWKEGTVSSRLAHARKELQQFLSRKGMTLAAALTAAGIADNAARAGIPPLLAASALRTARLFASGSSALMETVRAVQLAESMLRSMAALPWKTATALFMVIGLAVGGVTLAHPPEEAKQPAARQSPPAQAPPREQAKTEEKPRTDRYGDPLPEGALARFGTVRFRQGFLTNVVSFSPDGKTIACAAAGRGVCLWDAATGKELRQIGQATHGRSLAFSPNGQVLACAFDGTGGTALYETATGRKITNLPRGAGLHLNTLAFAPDGKTIAAKLERGNAIAFFDAASGAKRKAELACGEDSIYRLAWSPDGRRLAWVGEKGLIHLCDADKGEEIAAWKGHDKPTHGVVFSPDGKRLATGGLDETIRLWDAATHKELRILAGKHGYVRVVIFSHDGRLLASGHGDGTIALWDAGNGREIRSWQAHSFAVASLDFSADDKELASGAFWECGPRLWDVAKGVEARPFAGHTAPVDRLLFSPDGKRLLSLGREKKILAWDIAGGRERVFFQLPVQAAPRTLDSYTLSPKGDVAASWSYKDDTIRLWDAATGKQGRTLGKFERGDRDSSFFSALEFSPAGRLLAVGTKDGRVSVLDGTTGKEVHRLKGEAGKILCLAFSGDGRKIAAGSAGNGNSSIALWDMRTGKSLATFAGLGRVDSLAVSPDGKTLASAAWVEGRLHLWDTETGHEPRPLAQSPALYALAFSPDGKWLAGAGADHDQKVHVWEVATGLEVRSYRGHIGVGVLSIAFSPDGRTLASGGGDSAVMLWDFTGRIRNGRFQAAKWTPRELEQRWIDLASDAGPQAVQAIWDLVASPEQAVSRLRQRLKPVEPADAKRVERLLRDLDSDDFETRTRATAELESIVDGAEPALRKKLAEKSSLEMRQRIKQVLSKLEPSTSGPRLRTLRAIQVLEYAGTPEAREYLRALAKGVPEARLTREAKAALGRLAK